jgi:hypothetical protein
VTFAEPVVASDAAAAGAAIATIDENAAVTWLADAAKARFDVARSMAAVPVLAAVAAPVSAPVDVSVATDVAALSAEAVAATVSGTRVTSADPIAVTAVDAAKDAVLANVAEPTPRVAAAAVTA